MGTSRAISRTMWEFRYREKPRLAHLLVGLAVSGSTYALLWLGFRRLLTDVIAQLLSVGQIYVTKSLVSEEPQLIVKLLDNSDFTLALTWQRAGLVSIAIFGFLLLFLMFPLSGSIWLKIAWLELGFMTGLVWSLIRLSITVLVAYHFGAGAFPIAEFFMGPFTDFLWIVPVWSLGLSALVSAKHERVS